MTERPDETRGRPAHAQGGGAHPVVARVAEDGPTRYRDAASRRPAGAASIEEILAAARVRLDRVEPRQVYAARDAILVDIRPAAQRAGEGEIPGALIVERNVLEWRFDPVCDARLPQASGYDVRVVVFCSEGYTSSLAAAALHDLGLTRATDMIGGFRAWAAAGLPTNGANSPTSARKVVSEAG